jgi:hypothetical protein
MNRRRVAVFVTALALVPGVTGCGGSGKPSPARASASGAASDAARLAAHVPTLTQVRHDLARLPAWQRKIMLKEWKIMRPSERRGCPTHAQLHSLTLRLDAAAAGRASSSVLVLGCRAAEHGG